jgi:D-alanyl-D-alanine carboxypeptidase/D-alanyl-D-alanine-endopeptidase (penicillin-binding protein 4)
MRAAAAAIVWLLPLAANAATLAERMAQLLASSPAARAAFWGVEVVDLASGKTLAEHNAERFFIPASNTKLFTTALALTRLGGDFTFQTRVLAGAPPDAQGRIAGDLRLAGGGDPNLSPRPIPYRQGAYTGNPLAAIEDLADQIAARGVQRIQGGVVGDDTWYVWEPYGPGWSLDDPQYEYGAPVSALSINDNVQTLNVQPGARAGEVAALFPNPALEYYTLENRVRTAPGLPRRIHFERAATSRVAQLWGTIPLEDRGEDLSMGIADPAEFAAMALKQALEERGITVAGQAVARHLYADEIADLTQGAPPAEVENGIELARRVSAPLLEDLRVTAKVSQNLHAEMALRAVGRARRNVGSREAGLAELKAFLGEIGIAPEQVSINDGSGLSRMNLVTPAAVVELLRHMYESPVRDQWISILPVGAQDGTLNTRFANTPLAGRIHAKTGSVAHVSALSGYIERPDGWVAFSIFVNNFSGPAGEIRAIMDGLCALIME